MDLTQGKRPRTFIRITATVDGNPYTQIRLPRLIFASPRRVASTSAW